MFRRFYLKGRDAAGKLMQYFTEAKAESFRGKLILLLVDKLVVGAIIAVAFLVYDGHRREDQQRFETQLAERAYALERVRSDREELVADAQFKFQRARIMKEILPVILDKTTDVITRGYLLSSAFLDGFINPEVATEFAVALYEEGIPGYHISRMFRTLLPGGLGGIARHAAGLRDEARNYGDPTLAWQVLAFSDGPRGWRYVPPSSFPSGLQAIVKERLLWSEVLKENMPKVDNLAEREVATRSFLTTHLSALYFVLGTICSETGEGLFLSHGQTLDLIGALDCAVRDYGPTREAAERIGSELAGLDLTSVEDIAYARAIVDVLREYGVLSERANRHIAPTMAVHLAKLLVDDSFLHRVPWIAVDASVQERKKWLSEEPAASAHFSLQFAAGVVLTHMKSGARGAEPILVSFIDRLIRDLDGAKTHEDAARLRSEYGKFSARFAVSVLLCIDTEASKKAIQNVEELDEYKLAAFEGVRMELNSPKICSE